MGLSKRETEGAVSTVRDVEPQGAPSRLLKVELAVARTLAETADASGTYGQILAAIGTAVGWNVGAAWEVTPDGDALHCVGLWEAQSDKAGEFKALSERKTFAPGEGLPGRVWVSGEPAWIVDVLADENFPRARAAAVAGLHAAFAFPIRGPGGVLGAMEFFTRTLAEPDEELLGSIAVLGSLIGQFVVRRQAEEAAYEREALTRAILASALDAVITMDHEGRILEFNEAAERIFGYERKAVVGRELAEVVVPPSLRDRHRRGLARYLNSGRAVYLDARLELTGMRADGSEFPVELTITRINVPGPPMFTGFLRDINDRKRAEAELRASRARLVEAADTERRRLERNLHDGAQQQLVALALKLRLAAESQASDPELTERLLDEAQVQLAVGLEELRELARGIHPAALTERGLGPALAALADRSPVRVMTAALPDERLPNAVEVAAYYVVAEALTNIAKYAQAEQATVSIVVAHGVAVIEIVDDGVGGAASNGGSGVRGLADRVEALGGRLSIDSPPGAGTRIRAEIPTGPVG
jgi:PAS domain S-box-containing protein